MATQTAYLNILGLKRVKEKISHIEGSIFSKVLMGEIGHYVNLAIKKRTLEGIDANGVKFKSYTPSYALFRKKKGRSSKVNLFFSGSMFSSMTYEARNKQVKSYFLNTKDNQGAENPKKAFFLNKSRNFFALSEEDIKGVVDIIENYYRRIINV